MNSTLQTHLSTEAKTENLPKTHRHSQTYNLAKLVLKLLMQIRSSVAPAKFFPLFQNLFP